ncbi:MAG: hypothetical protein ACO1SV_23205 [Fimbriimonas sp.]
MLKRVSLIALAGLGSTFASAQVTPSGGGYLLRVKYSTGQVLRYASTNSVGGATGRGDGLVISLPIVMRVTEVKGKVAKARLTVGPAKNGNQILNNSQTVVMTLNNRNQGGGEGQSTGVTAQLPERPVKVGQTWTAVAPISTASGQVQRLNATYRFQGVKKVGGKSVAVITYSVNGAATGTGTMTLLQGDGTLWSNNMKIAFKGGTAPLTLTSNLKRA